VLRRRCAPPGAGRRAADGPDVLHGAPQPAAVPRPGCRTHCSKRQSLSLLTTACLPMCVACRFSADCSSARSGFHRWQALAPRYNLDLLPWARLPWPSPCPLVSHSSISCSLVYCMFPVRLPLSLPARFSARGCQHAFCSACYSSDGPAMCAILCGLLRLPHLHAPGFPLCRQHTGCAFYISNIFNITTCPPDVLPVLLLGPGVSVVFMCFFGITAMPDCACIAMMVYCLPATLP